MEAHAQGPRLVGIRGRSRYRQARHRRGSLRLRPREIPSRTERREAVSHRPAPIRRSVTNATGPEVAHIRAHFDGATRSDHPNMPATGPPERRLVGLEPARYRSEGHPLRTRLRPTRPRFSLHNTSGPTFPGGCQVVAERGCYGIVQFGEQVAVAIEGHVARGMTQADLDRLRVGTLGDGEGDARVAQAVEPARQANLALRRCEMVAPEARRDERSSHLFVKTSPLRPAPENRSTCSATSVVTGEMVIDRTADGVFGPLRSHSPAASRTSCSVTRTFPCRRSSLARRSPTSLLHRIRESTAR